MTERQMWLEIAERYAESRGVDMQSGVSWWYSTAETIGLCVDVAEFQREELITPQEGLDRRDKLWDVFDPGDDKSLVYIWDNEDPESANHRLLAALFLAEMCDD